MNRGPRRFSWLPPRAALSTGATDADLLARFTESSDEAAFELLVRRHSGMVYAACRRLLHDHNDADDAFQAVFLILARKAGSIARAEVVAGWLHRVAVRAALHLRAARARRHNREQPGVEQLPAPGESSDAGELARVLDEEIGRLPSRNRTAFILCCLEGKSGEEAA
ncbi:MAG TPA: sigma-70 family RNA polymerase sigma factor, partial [Gemmataceae bacterium]